MSDKTTGIIAIVVALALTAGAFLSGCSHTLSDPSSTEAPGLTAVDVSDVSPNELKQLADQIAQVSSLRFSGQSDNTEKLIRGTITSQQADQMCRSMHSHIATSLYPCSPK